MMEDELKLKRKIIILSLAALLIGCLFFLFGLSISAQLLLILNYCLALLLFICSFLVVYKQYQKEHQSIFLYIAVLSIFFIILVTVVTMIQVF